MSANLPTITEEPVHYANCCLSLSTKLLDVITETLQNIVQDGLVLSVGSGSGLLEALLLVKWANRSSHGMAIEGIEVYSPKPVNRYLPEEAINTVAGTWDLTERAAQASALLFVYPRQPVLVKEYMYMASKHAHSAVVIIWFGPRADWTDYEPCLLDVPGFQAVEIVADCGLVKYEMMAVLRRTCVA